MITLKKAIAIPGYMEPSELEWLAIQATTHLRIAEIGSYRGRSTRALADHTIGTVHAIDTWEGSPELKFLLASYPQGWLKAEFEQNLADCPQVIPCQQTSLAAAQALAQLRFDMIFIDALHDYENVCADIRAWLPLLSPGGLFCGHDHQHEDVARAVQDCLEAKFLQVETIWVALEPRLK